MAVGKQIRLAKALRELNISKDRALEYLSKKGIELTDTNPNVKIDASTFDILSKGFQEDRNKKEKSDSISEAKRKEKEALKAKRDKEQEVVKAQYDAEEEARKKAEEAKNKAEAEEKERLRILAELKAKDKEVQEKQAEKEVIKGKAVVEGPKSVGKIDLDSNSKKDSKKDSKKEASKTSKKDTASTSQMPKSDIENPGNIKSDKKKDFKGKDKSNTAKSEQKPTAKENSNEAVTAESSEKLKTKYQVLSGPKVVGEKIDLTQFDKKPKPKANDKNKNDRNKKKRKRIQKSVNPNEVAKDGQKGQAGANKGQGKDSNNKTGKNQANQGTRGKNSRNKKGRNVREQVVKAEPTEAEISQQIKETLEKLTGKGNKSKGAKYRRQKRDDRKERTENQAAQQEADKKVLKVTEFVTVTELATMMDVSINEVISSCMSLGIMVTMNQRLDAETLTIVAEEFGFETEFVSAELEEAIQEEADTDDQLLPRAPIVTVMGHVDHGKTSLLDYVREANVIAGESGGITQHIGAYSVEMKTGSRITFLDTPGHEAFTAMRARGAQVTDIAIIVIAADDDVMPQTKEAIAHAQAAEVPIIFAINKVDKPTANPDKVKESLSQMNLLVEDWGGKIQSQDISAKTGLGVDELMEKVLLEAEMLDLKANPDKHAVGTVVEASLDKGRGYVTTLLVSAGTLKIGDYMLAGKNSGKIKAMFDERGKNIKEAGPSAPVSILGLDGAPQAGDKFNVFEDEREAKQIAARRTQLQREQSVRTQKHITLDEIGRRIAIGDFKELNIILKGDVDGSVEALSNSLQKLSTDEIHVNIIHKAVGQITESDVLLATASDAIIIGFQVRPSGTARQIAEKESIDIRTYSIIYDAIEELKDAMEGMLSPEVKEEITGNVEIRETFKISKIGTIAGCMVLSGKVFRNSSIRIIRDGVVVHTGELGSLKRFKDDVKEVAKGYECGLNIKNYNDIAIGDIIEAYQQVEVQKKLK
jgi:translation initiation factor IF-2